MDFSVLQSIEVTEQRVRDLSTYLQAVVPGLFEEEATHRMSSKELIQILKELDEEFSYSGLNRVALLSYISLVVAAEVEPHVTDVVEESKDEEGEYRGGCLEVDWMDMVPELPGDLGGLALLAGVAASAYLNAALWEDPSWDTVATNQIVGGSYLELFLGMLGFLMLGIYTHVVVYKRVPDIQFHVNEQD